MRAGIVEFTTITASFEEDVTAYAAAGADTIGILEPKLTLPDPDARRLLADARLEAGACIPSVPSILPLPLMPGPESPEERVQAICASVRRLAAFEPSCVLCLTGPAGELDTGEARGIVVQGLHEIAAQAAAAGVPVALEPIQREFARFWTIVSTLEDAAGLAHEAGLHDIGFVFDTWHLWNDDGAPAALEREIDRIAAVHVADWRDPTRNTNDRVFPGDGIAPLGDLLDRLDRAGYDGPYEVEIFSDPELPDSLWRLPADEAARQALGSLRGVWKRRREG